MDCYGNLDDLVPINDSSGSLNITKYTKGIENDALMPVTLSRTETILHIVFISQVWKKILMWKIYKIHLKICIFHIHFEGYPN